MAARAQLRVVDDGGDAFELARRRWERVSSERRRLQEQLTGARYALGLVENPRVSATCGRPAWSSSPPPS